MPEAKIFWFTGLSGAGKSTIANGVQSKLTQKGYKVMILDGDNVRERSIKPIGFTFSDIKKNNLAILSLCIEHQAHYDAILVSIISPYSSLRLHAREALELRFYEIFIEAPIPTLQQRDTKGLYAKHSKGEIDNLIGLSASNPYEPPKNPELTINTSKEDQDVSIDTLTTFVLQEIHAKS